MSSSSSQNERLSRHLPPPLLRRRSSLPVIASAAPRALANKLARRTSTSDLTMPSTSNDPAPAARPWLGALLQRLPTCGGNLSGVIHEDREYAAQGDAEDLFQNVHDDDALLSSPRPSSEMLASARRMAQAASTPRRLHTAPATAATDATGLVSPCGGAATSRYHSTPVRKSAASATASKALLVTPGLHTPVEKTIKFLGDPEISKKASIATALTFETGTTATCDRDQDDKYDNDKDDALKRLVERLIGNWRLHQSVWWSS